MLDGEYEPGDVAMHDDGRVCTFSSFGRWHYGGPTSCWRPHNPAVISRSDISENQEANTENPFGQKGEPSRERGEFGFPAVGKDGSMFAGAEEPTEPWRAILTKRAMSVDFGNGQGYTVEAPTDDAQYIMEILPEIIGHFLHKNAQYARAQSGHDLGLKGIVPDINRKTSALITRIWDANNVWDENLQDSTEDLIDDLFGHLLLMRAKLRSF